MQGVTVACDPDELPLGSVVDIPAMQKLLPRGGHRMICEDTGRKIKGRRLDIRFDSCYLAREFGARRLAVRIISMPGKPAPEPPDDYGHSE